MTDQEILRAIQDWIVRLIAIIQDVEKKGNKPVLVALSRKMPRLMEWMLNNINSEFTNHNIPTIDGEDIDRIKQTLLTTELAIPFLCLEEQDKNKTYEFIIIDDVIRFGSTLQSVYQTVQTLNGNPVHICCVFVYNDAPVLNNSDWRWNSRYTIDNAKHLDEKQLLECSAWTSKQIYRNQLPIDLEFPIFDLEIIDSGSDKSKLQNLVENIAHRLGTFGYAYEISAEVIEIDNIPTSVNSRWERYSINLTEELESRNNVDFQKLRFWGRSDNKTTMQIFSPTIISKHELISENKQIFENPYYQAIWDESTSAIRRWVNHETTDDFELLSDYEETNISCMRSLCVWYNFLYSISCLVSNIWAFGEITKLTLDYFTIKYLIGNNISTKILPALGNIINHKQTAISARRKVNALPSCFSPAPLTRSIDMVKAEASIKYEDVSDILKEIFIFTHFSNIRFKSTRFAKTHLVFGETYESLLKSASVFKKHTPKREILIDINKWIDAAIDEGYIVPKYILKQGIDGIFYWRRYFFTSLRSFQNQTNYI